MAYSKTTKYQSEDVGDIIKSGRTFGVELELIHPDIDSISSLNNEIGNIFSFEHDGSVRGDNYTDSGIEIVSPVLKGKAGEDCIRNILEKVHKGKYETNLTCGFHIHLGGEDFNIKEARTKRIVDNPSFTVKSNEVSFDEEMYLKLKKIGTDRQILTSFLGLRNSIYDIPWIMSFKGRKFKLNLDATGRHMTLQENSTAIKKVVVLADEKQVGADKLKTLMLFYLAFNNLFIYMLPRERRNNNEFCKSLLSRISPKDVDKCTTTEELEKIWFRPNNRSHLAEKKGHKYDESRYYGVNFHALFAKYNTVEIRWHEGTTDLNQILYWTALHQKILDTISSKSSNGLQMFRSNCISASEAFDSDVLFKKMQRIIPLEPYLVEYFGHRLDFFNEKTKCAD